jgi:hypothetical protein
MDIASLSSNMNNMALNSAVNISLMKMNMDQSQNDMEAVTKMLDESSIDPNLGKIIDARV